MLDFTRDFLDAILAPGFVDIHMHGGAGVDVMRASLADLQHLNKFLTTHGVTGYFPTTVAAPLDQTCTALERIADAIEAAQASPARSMATRLRLFRLASIWKVHFSVTSAAAYILRKIWSSRRWRSLNASGRPRAVTSE